MSNDNSKTFLDYTGVETLVGNIKDNFLSNNGENYVGRSNDPAELSEFTIVHGNNENTYLSINNTSITLSTVDDAAHPSSVLELRATPEDSTQQSILRVGDNNITVGEEYVSINCEEYVTINNDTVTISNDNVTINNDNIIINGDSVTINSDNVTINNDKILTVNDNNVVSNQELTIGNFEIKNDQTYNYTFQGVYGSEARLADDDINIIAEYNHEGPKLKTLYCEHDDLDTWCYEFIVTEFSLDDDEYIEEASSIMGLVLNIPAAYLDADFNDFPLLEFDNNGNSEDVNIDGITNETSSDITGCFIRTAPYSLKHTSKALLNGVPVATLDDIQNIQIDNTLDISSTNAISNSVVTSAINEIEEVTSTALTDLNNKIDNIDIPEMPIVNGEADNSAVLKGEYKVGTTTYLNKALSKVSVSVGAGSTAGLKGWYYSAITFGTKPVITLSDTQPYVLINALRGGSWSSGTPNINVGDKISIVNDAKYDYCGEVDSISGNKITLKEALPFDSLAVSLISSNDPDDWTIYLPERANAGIIDFGGGSLAEGVNTQATNIGAHAEGIQSHAYGQYSHTEGFQTKAGYSAHAEGKNSAATGDNSHAEGQNTAANGNNSHAEGQNTIAAGKAAHAEGYNTVTGYTLDGTTYSGANSHAEGESTIAARGSHAEGVNTIAYGWQSHAEGKETIAHGSFSHTEGLLSIAAGSAAHAEGNQTKALGNAAHAEGYMTEAAELYAHAEGNETKATGKYSHTEGYKTEATTNNAHAEGNQTKAQGNSAHAEGKLTIAAKDFSHAGGLSSIASGIGSFAHGNYVTTTKDYEIAFGKFNVSNEDTIFSIGNGTDENSRSNILEIKNTSGENGVNYQAPKTDILFSVDFIQQTVINDTTVLVITYVSSNSNYATYKITYINESNYILHGTQEYIRCYDSTEHLILSVGDLIYVPLEKPTWESEYAYGDGHSEDTIIGYESNRCMYINTTFTKNSAIRITDCNYNPGLVQLIESANNSLFVNGGRVLIEDDEYINNTKSEILVESKAYTDNTNAEILAESKAYTDNTNAEILAESKAYTDNKFNNIDVDNNLPLQATANGGIIAITDDRVRPNDASGKSSFAIGGYVAASGNIYNGCNALGAASFSGGVDNYSNGICSFTYGFGLTTKTYSQKYGEAAFGKYNKSSNDTIFSVGCGSSDTNRVNALEIKTTGSVYASSFYETSDERIKIFTKPIETDLDKLSALRKSYFTYIEAPGTTQIGVSAQEVQKLYPEIVTENSNGLLTVDYSKLSVIALNAIDDLHKKNKELEDRLARLESIVKNIL